MGMFYKDYSKPSTPTTEAFQLGRTKKVNRAVFHTCEKAIRDMLPTLRDGRATEIVALNKSDTMVLLQQMLTEIFQCNSMNISWVPSTTANAYTYTKTWMSLNTDYKRSKTDKRLTPTNDKLDIYICLNSALVHECKMNEREILAILLHEIGHNYQLHLVHWILATGVKFYWMLATMVTDTINLNRILYSVNTGVSSFLAQRFPKLYNWIKDGDKEFAKILSALPKPILITALPYMLTRYINPAYYANYYNERHADNFAVDHGYGKDLASGLTKLGRPSEHTSSQWIKNNKIVGALYDLSDLQYNMMATLVGGYPSEQNRIVNTIERIKSNLTDPTITPSMRKDLLNQLADIEAFYKDYYLNENVDVNKNRFITNAYKKLVDEKFKGKIDIREILAKVDSKDGFITGIYE